MPDATPTVDAPSKQTRRFRRTRIGLSVFFGLLAVALCVLWVRSYYGFDFAFGPVGGGAIVTLSSARGSLWITNVPPVQIVKNAKTAIVPRQWYRFSIPISAARVERSFGLSVHPAGTTTGVSIGLPYWLLILSSVVLIAFSVRPLPRFSLRTMLIATTLISVVLGFAVWAGQ